MHNKDKAIFDKKLQYEFYILEELCDKGIIDVFEMSEAIILLRKKYKMPVISIYDKKTIIPPFQNGIARENSFRVIVHNKRSTTTINRTNYWFTNDHI